MQQNFNHYKNTKEEREAIATPSLTFFQDSWRRLKNKAAVFLLFTVDHHCDLDHYDFRIASWSNRSKCKIHQFAAQIPGININGLNGYAMVGGELVDKYAAANVPDGTYYLLEQMA